jgi:hypothetical protein
MANIVEIIKTFNVQLALKNIYSKIDEIIRKLNDSEPKYKVYTALLTQTGIDAPVATVLENTLGYNITWEYVNIGVYKSLGIVGTFKDGKFGLIQGAGNSSSLVSLWGYNSSMDFSEMLLECYDLGNVNSPGGLQLKDDILVNQFIEIRVYN